MNEPLGISFHGGDEQSGNVFAVETKAQAGYLLESHQHKHSHMSVLVSGEADVTVGGVTERMSGYRLITIPKDTHHKVQAVTDIVWLCLWADNLAPKELAYDSLSLINAEARDTAKRAKCCPYLLESIEQSSAVERAHNAHEKPRKPALWP